MRAIIVLSGGIGAGKSAISTEFQKRWPTEVLSSRSLLEDFAGTKDRAELQRVGAERDLADGGAWLCTAFVQHHEPRVAPDAFVIIDAVRSPQQVDEFRKRFGRLLLHVHVHASEASRQRRFEARGEDRPWVAVSSHETEAHSETLRREADVVIDTDQTVAEQVIYRLARRLGVGSGSRDRLVDVLVGGQWGSEGKGNVASYLAPEYGLLVRTGGPNSGHSVMLPSGESRVQYHLPSGTSTSNAQITLGPGAVIHPGELLREIREAELTPRRLRIDPAATVITERHKAAEAKLTAAIGSTGSGVGGAVAGRILDRAAPASLAKDVPELADFIGDSGEWIERALSSSTKVFVEGTQGTGLSLLHGSYPHVTSRDTTVGTLLAEAGIAPGRLRKVVLVIRSYPIRVADPLKSTSGPMYMEISWDDVAARSGLDAAELKTQEHTSRTKKLRRVGEFDWKLLFDSARLNGPTDIAVTFVDQIDAENVSARRFDQLSNVTRQFIGEVESVCGAPATLISTRFHTRSVIDRRNW